MTVHLATSWQDRLARAIRRRLIRATAMRLDCGTRRSIDRMLGLGMSPETISRAAQRVGAISAVRVWAYLRHIGRI